ncbi:MAG: hypothetical protein ACRD4Y_06585, partial [Candidatus Acidiferrales bacterium]
MQNFSQVAASASEIKAVLVRDPGLMVELKRWVAKDATDHGQVLTESDLTDFAIFDRLENDVEFRSIATLLVQRYGYLLPQLNPQSEMAKEQDLLRAERTKWIAQSQEEERAQARQKMEQEMQKASSCNDRPETHCESNRPEQPSPLNAPEEPANEGSPLPLPPHDRNIPEMLGGPQIPLQRADLMQSGHMGGAEN